MEKEWRHYYNIDRELQSHFKLRLLKRQQQQRKCPFSMAWMMDTEHSVNLRSSSYRSLNKTHFSVAHQQPPSKNRVHCASGGGGGGGRKGKSPYGRTTCSFFVCIWPKAMDQTLLPHNCLWGRNGFISEHTHTHTHTHTLSCSTLLSHSDCREVKWILLLNTHTHTHNIIMFYSTVTQQLLWGKMNFITEHTHNIIMFYSTVTQQLLWGIIGFITELTHAHTHFWLCRYSWRSWRTLPSKESLMSEAATHRMRSFWKKWSVLLAVVAVGCVCHSL